ncbi:hypothetical protein FRC01_014836, partial [Tulasnella sp. 417]
MSEGSTAGGVGDHSDSEQSDEVASELENQSPCEIPPEAPPRHTMRRGRKGGYRFTDTDKEFITKYVAWAKRNNVRPWSYVYWCMAKLMPWHSAGSITSF